VVNCFLRANFQTARAARPTNWLRRHNRAEPSLAGSRHSSFRLWSPSQSRWWRCPRVPVTARFTPLTSPRSPDTAKPLSLSPPHAYTDNER